jgi:hypothetical protein
LDTDSRRYLTAAKPVKLGNQAVEMVNARCNDALLFE